MLTTEGHAGKAYELGGAPFTLSELAAEISRQSGKPVTYTNLPEADYAAVLLSAGLPEPYANMLADSDRGLSQGDLFVDGDDLQQLIGRTPTTLAEALAIALA